MVYVIVLPLFLKKLFWPKPIQHSFSVIRSADSTTYNFANPVRCNTVNTGFNGSNTTIRFVTDNPGPWFLHWYVVLFHHQTKKILNKPLTVTLIGSLICTNFISLHCIWMLTWDQWYGRCYGRRFQGDPSKRPCTWWVSCSSDFYLSFNPLMQLYSPSCLESSVPKIWFVIAWTALTKVFCWYKDDSDDLALHLFTKPSLRFSGLWFTSSSIISPLSFLCSDNLLNHFIH